MRKRRFFVLFDVIVALTILIADFCRALMVSPFTHWHAISLPAPITFLSGALKPEYRES